MLDGAVEGIGEGEKGGWLLLMRWGMKYRRFEFSEFTERVVPFLNVSDGRVTVVPATEYD